MFQFLTYVKKSLSWLKKKNKKKKLFITRDIVKLKMYLKSVKIYTNKQNLPLQLKKSFSKILILK